MPLLAAQVMQQSLVEKAAISQQGHRLACGEDGTDLLEHWLIVLKSYRRALVGHHSPGQRQCTASIDE